MRAYSVVVPLYNEEGNVQALHAKIYESMTSLTEPFEIILVDDGSTDSTREQCKNLKNVTCLFLRKNSGQTAAMDAGIKASTKEYKIKRDEDLQNEPQDIPRLIQMMKENEYDVISGWRKKRNDPFMKRFISRGAYFLRQILLHDGIHDSGCSLKIYKRECFASLDLYGEMHRFIPALLKMKGFRIGEMEVVHHARTQGETKYTWRRTVKGFLDMISVWFWQKYAARPLHFLGGIGLLFFVTGGGRLIACRRKYF